MPARSRLWSTICEGILSVVVGICGLMGNGATIAVLSRPTFRETFHKLLICLSCFDSLFIGKLKKEIIKACLHVRFQRPVLQPDVIWMNITLLKSFHLVISIIGIF